MLYSLSRLLLPSRPISLVVAVTLVLAGLAAGPWAAARAQFDIGIGGGSRYDDRPRGEHERGRDHDHGRAIGTGIGIGIELGREIERSTSKPTDTTVSTKSRSDRPKRYGRKDDKKKDGEGKTAKGDKKDDKKDDGKNVATAIDDCLLIIEYPPGQIAAPDGATNTDLKGSAAALKASLKGTSAEETINKDTKIDDALKKLTQGGKCCKRIVIFGHGYQDGSLMVPYPTSSDTEGDKAYHLGGSGMSKKLGQDAFNAFAKTVKDALCKDPKGGKVAKDSEVRIHACWSADNVNQDHPIAEELSKTGVTAWGYQGVVKFPYTAPEDDDSKREYSAPTPENGGEYKKIDAVQTDDKKK